MHKLGYCGSSIFGMFGLSAFLLACIVAYCFTELFHLFYPLPEAKLLRMKAIDSRNFANAWFTSIFAVATVFYAVIVAVNTVRYKCFPYPSMWVPVRMRIRAVNNSSTVWLCLLIVVLSALLQLTIAWHTWYKWNELLVNLTRY